MAAAVQRVGLARGAEGGRMTKREARKLKHWSARLEAFGACTEGLRWARKHSSFAKAWAQCERFDWLLWATLACINVEHDGLGHESRAHWLRVHRVREALRALGFDFYWGRLRSGGDCPPDLSRTAALMFKQIAPRPKLPTLAQAEAYMRDDSRR